MEGIGDRVRQARTAAGLTQEALARAVNTSTMTISRYERGAIREPSSKVLSAIAKVTNVSTHWLATGEDLDTSPELPEPPFWREFLEKYEHIAELTSDELIAIRKFRGRSHRISGWTDWVQLAEWLRNRKPSPTFEAVVKAEEET